MKIEIKFISNNEKEEHLLLIKKNQKSEARRIDPEWRKNLNEENYTEWLTSFNQQGSQGVYLDNNLIGEVIFYKKDDKTYFGMWIDCDLINKGIGQEIFKLIIFPPDVYVEFLKSNERVTHLLLKHKLNPVLQNETMKYCKIS